MEKKKRENFTTPTGVAVYPHLNSPDNYEGKETYNVKLRYPMDGAGVTELKALIDEQFDENFREQCEIAKSAGKKRPKKCVHIPYRLVEDDTGEPTGDIEFSFKLPASIKERPTQVKLFDAKGQLMEDCPAIWGGSKLKVNFYFYGWNVGSAGAGITLRLRGVQVIDLVTGGGGYDDAESYGFGTEEGFEFEAAVPRSSDAPFNDEADDESDF